MKVYILKWLATGRIAKTAYLNRDRADRVAKNANDKRGWVSRSLLADQEWVVFSLEVK